MNLCMVVFIHSLFMHEKPTTSVQPGAKQARCTVISRPDFCRCLSTDDLAVITGSMCKQAVLDQLSKQLGRQVSISRFLRMEVGEGIQR